LSRSRPPIRVKWPCDGLTQERLKLLRVQRKLAT
jgi:hypothetical protein